ncbi:bone marrow proteoglycan [Orycteropus afer afer]|uniref:Bone marrow proteoglycan n=1 Tax=Orycteropus afer afer TaxID=1230840 RepID=A0A8B7AWU3_ORYAF|nr:bone marrow proteoglycan [Orycteropus afer afer]
MQVPLLLALLFGAVSAFHLSTETSKFDSALGEEILPQDDEVPEQKAEVERGSGSEDCPEEEEPTESVSALAEVDSNFQCPKEEDTVKLVGSPGCKTCRFLVVKCPRSFDQAQITCRNCYRGNLVSIHNVVTNFQIQCSVSSLNQGQVWIGARVTGWGPCQRFSWIDGSCWNFAYWAGGHPSACGGHCVSLCTRGGHWTVAHCGVQLPFICSY